MYQEDKALNPGVELKPAISPQELRTKLIRLLRTPSQWPEGFVWDFEHCSTCAIGLAACALGVNAGNVHLGFVDFSLVRREASALGVAVGLDMGDAYSIFVKAGLADRSRRGRVENVKPWQIADLLEAAPFV